MKVFSIMRKTLLELLREPALLGLMFLFPILLLVFYYVAFGKTDQGIAKFLTVLVVNEDTGTTNAEGTAWQAGADLIAALRAEEFEGSPLLNIIETTDRQAASTMLLERRAAMLITIPADFSQALEAAAAGMPFEPATITLMGDPNSGNSVFARSLVEGIIQALVPAVTGTPEALTAAYTFVPGTGTTSDFDFGVSGIIVFGIVLLSVTTASVLVREHVSGTLRRLRLTRARARDLLLGVLLSQMLLALLIVPVTFGAALLFGFHSNGSLLLAIFIGLLFSVSVVGIGLIVACFARNDGEAANLSAVVGVVMVILSGAMYPMPAAPLFTLGERTIQLYDLLPPAHAGEALRQVLIFGEGLDAIGFEITALTVVSAGFLMAGVMLYQRLQLGQP